MNPSRSPSSGFHGLRFAACVFLVHLVSLGPVPACLAQGFGPDPFRPYNSQYDSFVYPVAPGPMDAGYNRGGVNGIRGANQFENYLNSLQGAALGTGAGTSGGAGLRGGIGTPYYQANRAYDREYNRIYQPNKEADDKFERDQSKVTSLYFEYLREKDPKKRVELFRDYSRARRRADLDLAAPRATATRTATRAPRRSVTAADGGEAAGLSGRDRSSPPPALPSRGTRARSGRTDSGTSPDLGPAPSPLGDSNSRSATSRTLVPSEVLDRARRTDRTRPSSRVRAPSPGPAMPAPDPLKP